MPNKTEEELLRLFDVFTKNLNIVRPNYSDVFICPICEKHFARDQINPELSRAHIWPDALGGTWKTLTCKKCNNDAGTKIEPHLIEYSKHLNADRHYIKGNMEGKKERFSAYEKITKTEKGELLWDVHIDSKHSNPKTLSQFMETSDSNLPTINFERNLRFVESKIPLAYLHFAYLYLFHHFGYDWMRMPSNVAVREQLKNPEKEIFNPIVFDIPDITLEQFGKKPNEPFLVILLQPRDLIGFLVVAPKLFNDKPRWAILFPKKEKVPTFPFSKTVNAEFSLPIDATHNRLIEPIAEKLCSRVMFDM